MRYRKKNMDRLLQINLTCVVLDVYMILRLGFLFDLQINITY